MGNQSSINGVRCQGVTTRIYWVLTDGWFKRRSAILHCEFVKMVNMRLATTVKFLKKKLYIYVSLEITIF